MTWYMLSEGTKNDEVGGWEENMKLKENEEKKTNQNHH